MARSGDQEGAGVDSVLIFSIQGPGSVTPKMTQEERGQGLEAEGQDSVSVPRLGMPREGFWGLFMALHLLCIFRPCPYSRPWDLGG